MADRWLSARAAALVAAVLLVGTVAGLALRTLAPPRITLETMDDQLGIHEFSDRGRCELRARNASRPWVTHQRDFPCEFSWKFVGHRQGTTRLHEQLYDVGQKRVVSIPGLERGDLQEWYTVRNRIFAEDAYRYTFSDEAGAFSPPPGARDRVTLGLVESGGRPDGDPQLLVARTFEERGVDERAGLDAVHWNSSYRRARIQWHGYDQLRTEHVDAWVDRPTGFVLDNRVHVVIEVTPDQLARTSGAPLPPDLHGGEPVKVLELSFATTADSMQAHAEQIRRFHLLMGILFNGHLVGAAAGIGAVAFGAVAWRRRGTG